MNLLVAIDDSRYSETCLREVASRPWPPGTHVRVLSVTGIHPGAPLPEMGVSRGTAVGTASPPIVTMEAHAVLQEAARRTAAEAIEKLQAAGLQAQLRIREGTPGTEIVEEAREWPADLIVVGSRGRGAIKRLLLGSVATYVMQHAPCSVEVVRDREPAS